MAEVKVKTISCEDFVDMAHKLYEASDGHGNKLFDREEVAEAMGFTDVGTFEQKLKEARTMYRKSLQEKVRKMYETGIYDRNEISDKTGMNASTIDILLNKEYDDRMSYVSDFKEQRQKSIDELANSVNEMFKKNSLFNSRL